MLKKTTLSIVVIIAFFSTAVGMSWAQGIKERMRSRLPAISEMKGKGLVGENNRGYLQVLPGKSAPAQIVQAENADRREIYQAIANREDTSLEVVEKHRARQNAAKAKAGHWFQNAGGQWVQR